MARSHSAEWFGGLQNAPLWLQRVINVALLEVGVNNAHGFFDDIMVGSTVEEW